MLSTTKDFWFTVGWFKRGWGQINVSVAFTTCDQKRFVIVGLLSLIHTSAQSKP